MKLTVSIQEILDSPFYGSWGYIRKKYGLQWRIDEGLAKNTDTVEISVEDARYIGLLEYGEKYE